MDSRSSPRVSSIHSLPRASRPSWLRLATVRSSGMRKDAGPMPASAMRRSRPLNCGTPLRSIGVCQCTDSATSIGSTMAMFVSPRKRLGKMKACAGPSRRRRRAGAGGVAQPLEGPLVARRPIDLDVAAAPVAYHRLDGALVPHHTLVLRAPHRLEQGEMDEAQVIAVAVVLGEHLPVGGTAMPDPARGELDLAFRREIAGAVDEPCGGTKMLGEGNALGVEAREHEAAIGLHAGSVQKATGALVERGVPAGIGHAEELAAHIVGPAVVGTLEGARVTVGRRAHHGAAMHAAVQQHPHPRVAGAREDDGLPAQRARDEIARARDLALVTHEHPAAVKDPLHLVVEDTRVPVQRSVDAIALYEAGIVDSRRRRFTHGAVV